MKIQLRYNTECKGESNLYWRVVINGVQHLASNVFFNLPTITTRDYFENIGFKHSISCETENLIWNGTELTVNP